MQRPFSSPDEMNDIIISNANAIIAPDDQLVVVGDVISNSAVDRQSLLPLIAKVNGKKILVRGNHDRSLTDEDFKPYFHTIYEDGKGFCLSVDNDAEGKPQIQFYVNHYPTQSKSDRFNLVGHIHSSWKVQKNMLNVGVDVHHFRPIPITRIPFFVRAVSDFYDSDVWVGDHPANVAFSGRGKKGRYLDAVK